MAEHDEQQKWAANRVLAEALGWTAKELPHRNGGGTYGILVNPEGKCVYSFGAGGEVGFAQVWKHAPDYYASVDAVLDTLSEDFSASIFSTASGKYFAQISAFESAYAWAGWGDTRAIALAAARLVMAHALAQQEGE